MHIQDIKKIISEINKGEYGVNPRFIFECPECSHGDHGSPDGCQFFFSELTDSLSSEDLLYQAYILVNKVGLSYSDVKGMTQKERLAFINFYTEEIKKLES
jgi:hypothetical protein